MTIRIVVCPFVLFLLTIVFSVPFWFTDYDYPFGIFKLFFAEQHEINGRENAQSRKTVNIGQENAQSRNTVNIGQKTQTKQNTTRSTEN